MTAQNIRGLYETLLRERDAYAPARTKPQPSQLRAFNELHFLDWHACRLSARSGLRTWLVLKTQSPLHVQSRVDAVMLDQHDGPTVAYESGAVFARFLNTPDWSNICDPVETLAWPSIPLINQHAGVARKHR